MSALLAQAQQMQQKLMEAQQQLANAEVHGQAGGGLVSVVVKGSGEVVAVKIDPSVVDPSDVETPGDAAVVGGELQRMSAGGGEDLQDLCHAQFPVRRAVGFLGSRHRRCTAFA